MSSRIDNLKKKASEIGLEIIKIDEFIASTPDVSVKVVLDKIKQRKDFQDAHSYVSFLIKQIMEEENEKNEKPETSKIISLS